MACRRFGLPPYDGRPLARAASDPDGSDGSEANVDARLVVGEEEAVAGKGGAAAVEAVAVRA
jgi:hypothetical protein